LMDGMLSRGGANGATLDDSIYSATVRLYAEATASLERGDFASAVRALAATGDGLPRPFENWDASTRILSTMAEAYWRARAYPHALTALQHAMHCPHAIGDPWLHLRLGQVHLELGDVPRASDELARAYMGAGPEIFAGEDAKYFTHVQSVLDPPVGGTW